MFTSRAEFRLSLRADNADLRLTERGSAWGCVGSERLRTFESYRAGILAARQRALAEGGYPSELARKGIGVREDGRWRSVLELLGHGDVAFATVAAAYPWLAKVPGRALSQLQTEALYAGYLPRQQSEIRALGREEAIDLNGVTFAAIGGLSAELVTKLTDVQPRSLGAAGRIQGMTPAAIAAIAAYIRKRGALSVPREPL
jgi:tRNA uridine 5-carboxymethylaminomethyl modification enzyme